MINYIDILFGVAIGYLIGVVSGYVIALYKYLDLKGSDKEEKGK